jgi:hypothetical protein
MSNDDDEETEEDGESEEDPNFDPRAPHLSGAEDTEVETSVTTDEDSEMEEEAPATKKSYITRGYSYVKEALKKKSKKAAKEPVAGCSSAREPVAGGGSKSKTGGSKTVATRRFRQKKKKIPHQVNSEERYEPDPFSLDEYCFIQVNV